MKPRVRKNRLSAVFPFWRAALALAFCLALLSCRPSGGGAGLLPRPQPGYTAWLERQSMAVQADKLISQVTQTGRVWMFSSQGAPPEALLKAAPQWLDASSLEFHSGGFLSGLASGIPLLLQSGVKGLYLGPLGEDQSYWGGGGKNSSARRLSASLELDPALGDEKALAALMGAAESAGLELGADIAAAAAFMGPDFFLQARSAAGHGGLYAMLELPRDLWDKAPPARSEWEGAALSQSQAAELAGLGLLPESLPRDRRAWGPPAGWAATGEIQGTDGKPRRWLYRFEGSPSSPVFLWQDPSGLARKIFSASIIQQTGFWRLPLAGLRLSALMGLEPDSGSGGAADEALSAAPGLEALNILAAYVHRSGGWALQADPVPLAIVEAALEGACDFCREDLTAELVLEALASGRPDGLAALFRRWIKAGLDQRRLARGFNAWERPLPADSPAFAGMALLSFRLGVPGLAFVSPGELGLYDSSVPSDPKINEFLKSLLTRRADLGLAEARMIKAASSGGALALLSGLPNKGFWLTAVNFSSSPEKISLTLPEECRAAADAASGEDLSSRLDGGQKFAISLDGHEARHVIFSHAMTLLKSR